MDNVPDWMVLPPLRCHERCFDREPFVCASAAPWMRTTGGGLAAAFFCDAHRQPGDVPIASTLLYRRVSLTAQVLFAGTSSSASLAHAEAVARLEQAVAAAGGILSLHTVTSAIGRWTASAGVGRWNMERVRA